MSRKSKRPLMDVGNIVETRASTRKRITGEKRKISETRSAKLEDFERTGWKSPIEFVANNTVVPYKPQRTKQIRRSFNFPKKTADPLLCGDIIDTLYATHYAEEETYWPKPFFDFQRNISGKMRSILIDWLADVHYKLLLHSSSLWLCVNIVDRFLTKQIIVKGKLQLLGVIALLVATKMEDQDVMSIPNCCYFTDFTYNKEQAMEMEILILETIQFNLHVPTGYTFLEKYLFTAKADGITRHLAYYYAERNLQESDVLTLRPHHFAAAAIFLALLQRRQAASEVEAPSSVWPDILVRETGLLEEDLVPIAQQILGHVRVPSEITLKPLLAVKKKYELSQYLKVSLLPLPVLPTTNVEESNWCSNID